MNTLQSHDKLLQQSWNIFIVIWNSLRQNIQKEMSVTIIFLVLALSIIKAHCLYIMYNASAVKAVSPWFRSEQSSNSAPWCAKYTTCCLLCIDICGRANIISGCNFLLGCFVDDHLIKKMTLDWHLCASKPYIVLLVPQLLITN